MSLDIVEEYDRLSRPDLYRQLDQAWKTDPGVQRALDGFRDSFGEVTDERIRAASRAWLRKRLEGFDDAILKAINFSLDDLVEAKFRKVNETRAGTALPQSPQRKLQRRNALLAIRGADQAGVTWGEAIAAAQSASMQDSGREIDRKTIDRWLRELHEWNLIGIAPPPAQRRGRPPKKE